MITIMQSSSNIMTVSNAGSLSQLDLILYSLAIFGFWYCIGYAKISYRLRLRLFNREMTKLLNLLQCPACSGFWLGAFTGIWLMISYQFSWVTIPLLAFYTIASNFILGSITGVVSDE